MCPDVRSAADEHTGKKTRSLASTAKSASGELALKPNQLQAIALLIHGRSIKDTGPEVGVHANTVSTWLRENEAFMAEYDRQRRECYMRDLQLAHATLAEVMENKSERGLTRTKAAQAALLYDGQRLRARTESETALAVPEKLQAALGGRDADTIDAEYRALGEGESSAEPV